MVDLVVHEAEAEEEADMVEAVVDVVEEIMVTRKLQVRLDQTIMTKVRYSVIIARILVIMLQNVKIQRKKGIKKPI